MLAQWGISFIFPDNITTPIGPGSVLYIICVLVGLTSEGILANYVYEQLLNVCDVISCRCFKI